MIFEALYVWMRPSETSIWARTVGAVDSTCKSKSNFCSLCVRTACRGVPRHRIEASAGCHEPDGAGTRTDIGGEIDEDLAKRPRRHKTRDERR